MDFNSNLFIRNFLKTDLFTIYQLAGDASTRKYFRIVKENQSWVLMSWDPFDPDKYPFLSVQKHFLNNKIHVPEVLDLSSSEGLVILEDLGDLTLERKYWEEQNHETSLLFYQKSIDELIKIHFHATNDKRDCIAHNIEFDVDKFLWELNYAHENLLLKICKIKISEKQKTELFNVYKDICINLDKEQKYIVHRDYHSRNLMIKFDQIRVIDFQDARLGPLQYDLVSLLRDSYVDLSEEMANDLINYYLKAAKPFLPKVNSLDHFKEIYELQTIQRCFKACGSFSSFYNQRSDTRYLKYISQTLKRVIKSLGEFQKYKLLADVIIDSGAIEKRYEDI